MNVNDWESDSLFYIHLMNLISPSPFVRVPVQYFARDYFTHKKHIRKNEKRRSIDRSLPRPYSLPSKSAIKVILATFTCFLQSSPLFITLPHVPSLSLFSPHTCPLTRERDRYHPSVCVSPHLPIIVSESAAKHHASACDQL